MSNINVVVPPNYEWPIDRGKKIFLAGTIDNGNSIDWQREVINLFSTENRDITFFNPRRADWPSDDAHNEIVKQINWELDHLERADLIVMNILGSSKSPISLMEIGLFAKSGKLLVFCPENYYRFDNVRIVCERFNIPLFDTNDLLVIKHQVDIALEKQ